MLSAVLLFPLVSIIAALNISGRFRNPSLVLSLASFIGGGIFYYESRVCTAYFCGLGYVIQGAALVAVMAIVAFILAIIPTKHTRE